MKKFRIAFLILTLFVFVAKVSAEESYTEISEFSPDAGTYDLVTQYSYDMSAVDMVMEVNLYGSLEIEGTDPDSGAIMTIGTDGDLYIKTSMDAAYYSMKSNLSAYGDFECDDETMEITGSLNAAVLEMLVGNVAMFENGNRLTYQDVQEMINDFTISESDEGGYMLESEEMTISTGMTFTSVLYIDPAE